MNRDRKPRGFYHLVHGTVDSKHNILIGLKVTPSNLHDASVYVENLDELFQTLPLTPKYAKTQDTLI